MKDGRVLTIENAFELNAEIVAPAFYKKKK
jgi:hypothetical protein